MKIKDKATPNPGGNPGKTKGTKRTAGIGPQSAFGKKGSALGSKLFSNQGFTSHGNLRGR